ncbi:tyrosine-type recombinase/integrase [Neisseria animaloris]|uniref:tyrosine-type recombinase/integrase n=1 Tax=Neisseria animaloris TaxID=326522 RepID=UPI000A19357F|nr:tyrosine-type recombinase/integrase [Neisseria animaloris]OSI06823.1 integrase [Neisseria animaloris]
MGTITKRTNPSGNVVYRAQIRIKKTGYPDFSESRTFSKKAMAVEWLKRREAELELHPELLFQETKKTLCPTLREAAKRYAEEVATEYSESKFRTLNFVMNFEIADKRIDRLRREDFTSYAFKRQRGQPQLGLQPVKPATINSDLQYLRSVIKHAHFVWGLPVTWSEIDIAIEGLRRARVIGKADQRERLPTAEELQKLTDYFYFSWCRRSTNDMRVPMHLIIWFAIYSCRRQSEIGRLEWADLNMETRQWLVKDVKHPRGSKGNHKRFEIRDELLPVIEAIKDDQVQKQMRGNPNLLLGGYQSKTISTLFTKACKALFIDDLRFHDLRHEGATRLAENGLTIPQMQQVTLHGDWESMRIYTNLRPRPRRLDFKEAMQQAQQAV